ncbi:MAG: hypothetical protein AAGD12_18400, partial [Pseudomonadota bacterium]
QARAGSAPVRVTEDTPAALLRNALLAQAQSAGFPLEVAILRTRPSQSNPMVERTERDTREEDPPTGPIDPASEPPEDVADAQLHGAPAPKPTGGGAGGPARS